MAGLLLCEELLVQRSEHFNRPQVVNGDVTGIVWAAVGGGDEPGAGQRKRAATVSTESGSDVIGNFLKGAIDRVEADFCVALIGVKKIDTAVVGGPVRALDVAIELIREGVGAATITVHEIEFGGLVTLVAVVETDVGDPLSVGRYGRRVVGSFAVGQGAEGAVSDAELIDFGIEILVIRFGMTVDGKGEVLSIGSPGGARGAEFVATVGEIAVGDLPGRATLGVDDKNLHVAGLQVPRAIETIDEAIVHGGRVGPLCARRRSGKVGEMGTLSENESGEGEHRSIRRPSDGIGRLIDVRDTRGLAGVHPANVELLLAVGVGKIRDACAVGGPTGRHVTAIASSERTMIRSVRVDGPEI